MVIGQLLVGVVAGVLAAVWAACAGASVLMVIATYVLAAHAGFAMGLALRAILALLRSARVREGFEPMAAGSGAAH